MVGVVKRVLVVLMRSSVGGMVIGVVRELLLCESRIYRCRRTGPARSGGAGASCASVLVVR